MCRLLVESPGVGIHFRLIVTTGIAKEPAINWPSAACFDAFTVFNDHGINPLTSAGWKIQFNPLVGYGAYQIAEVIL